MKTSGGPALGTGGVVKDVSRRPQLRESLLSLANLLTVELALAAVRPFDCDMILNVERIVFAELPPPAVA